MDPTLQFMVYLALILLGGLVCSLLSIKLKIPNVLLLILLGVLFAAVTIKDFGPLIAFPSSFVTGVAVLAIVIIIFDGTSRLKFKDFDIYSIRSTLLVIVSIILNMVLLSTAASYLFGFEPFYLNVIFAAIITGTAADVVLSMVKIGNLKVLKILEIESLINTPIIVLLPFIIIDFVRNAAEQAGVGVFVINQLVPFLQQIVTGIGAGVLVGLVVFKALKKQYTTTNLSQLAIIAAALLTYVLAEALNGSGVLAVTTLGLFFGISYMKEKKNLTRFANLLSSSLEILVFVLVGMLIDFPLELGFVWKALALYALYLVFRFVALEITMAGKIAELKEKVFMTLMMPKGTAVAVVALTLSTMSIPGIHDVINLALAFLLISVIISTISVRFSKYFIGQEVAKESPGKDKK